MAKKMKPIIALLLCLCFLAVPLLSCGNDSDDGNTPTSALSSATSTSVTEATEPPSPYLDDLDEYNFNGDEFHVLSVTSKEGTYTVFDVKEASPELLDNAIYMRNSEIEERFNIDFVAHDDTYGNCYNALKQQVVAGDHTYDLIMLINRNAYTAALDNQIMKVSDLPELDLTKDYYLQDINKMCSIGDKVFLAYSEESLYTFQRAVCLAFNKDMAENHGIENLYQAVYNGTWTFEKMYQVIEDTTVLDGADYVYGMYGQGDYIFTTFFHAAGEYLVEKQGDTLVFTAPSNEKLVTITDVVLAHIDNKTIQYSMDYSTDDWNGEFKNGHAMFNGTVMGKLMLLRDISGFDYGVLPWPKYEEGQDRYYSRVVDAWLHVAPSNTVDAERTSVILEALASGSAKYVFPAFYENAMQSRVARDEDTIRMMEIIRHNRVFDWGDVTWAEKLRSPMMSFVFVGRTQSLTAFFRSCKTRVENLISEMESSIEKLG